METLLINSATIAVLLFGILGLFDGLYFHLIKFKLYKHPETRFEHITHSIRAFLFVGILYLLFINDFTGYALWGAIVLVLVDIATLLIDLFVEGNSRNKLGGLPHKEYIVHVIANTLHFVSIALMLASKPATAFRFEATKILHREAFTPSSTVGFGLLGGAMVLAILHLVLMSPTVQQKVERFYKRK